MTSEKPILKAVPIAPVKSHDKKTVSQVANTRHEAALATTLERVPLSGISLAVFLRKGTKIDPATTFQNICANSNHYFS
jgi:hypothetical protein